MIFLGSFLGFFFFGGLWWREADVNENRIDIKKFEQLLLERFFLN